MNLQSLFQPKLDVMEINQFDYEYFNKTNVYLNQNASLYAI